MQRIREQYRIAIQLAHGAALTPASLTDRRSRSHTDRLILSIEFAFFVLEFRMYSGKSHVFAKSFFFRPELKLGLWI